MKAAGYVRVSTDDQKNSVEAQVQEIKNFCTFKGFELTNIFIDEDVSGGTEIAKRPQGVELIKLALSKSIDVIITSNIERMFRNNIDGLMTSSQLNDVNVGMIFLNMGGNIIDTRSSTGELVFGFLLSIVQFERKRIGERVTVVLQHKKRTGQVYSGKTPYGKTREGKSLVECPEESIVISKVLFMKEQGMSLQDIADKLNEQGVLTKENTKWHKSMIHKICKRKLEVREN
jgi:DNA invertase Pin-like site-specific DNA recombinase